MGTKSHDLNLFPPGLRGRRILLCTESLGPVNGVSRTTVMLVNQLRSHGALVAVVAPHNHTKVNTFSPINSPGGEGPSFNEEVRLQGYPLPFNPELSVAYPVRLSELYRRTFGGPPDLIYLASPASLGFQVMLQIRQHTSESQVPIICNFQTDLARYCLILFPWPLGDIANRVFAFVQGYLFRHPSVKTIFYPSTSVRRYLNHAASVPDDKLEALRRGVDTEAFNPSKRREQLRREWAPNGELILFTCSRLAGEKGFGFLAQAAAELDKRGLDFKLVVVGGNWNAVIELEVKETARSLAQKGKVVFAGFKVGEELNAHYASADVFLHCSVTETFGLVVLEAMASGVPVVARDEGGPSDIIEHGRTGYLVPPDDLEGFVRTVLELGRDPRRREQLAEAGRAAACQATWEGIGNKVAWAMLDTIEESERDKKRGALETRLPILGWPLPGASVRRLVLSHLVDAWLGLALSIVVGFWAVVGSYLLFANIVHVVKDRAPQVRAAVNFISQR
ncbi:glycosyltransferase family 4 protein [Durotheca rogersii]|uniref:glycosyltransferase family 4 protein n=1 Tax=Durotheca rogersii TaxID=419775 RepID=UPI00221FCF3B|nr:glycosyltransferase family 4 protein [Durotheca rogersii]KAI5856741.1 glycosyltransferase family 4 protein [Durotheca rogersii]